ncbi:MAG: hypothetical protein D6725_06115 [Planctomycetota bacterium]|nr:MAG: hypothetical protein D6725_06115 [Planctomycetota bacterium]
MFPPRRCLAFGRPAIPFGARFRARRPYIARRRRPFRMSRHAFPTSVCRGVHRLRRGRRHAGGLETRQSRADRRGGLI